VTLTARLGSFAAAFLLCVCAVAAGDNGNQVYLYEDVLIAGKVMHSFTSAGENVSVVLGEFSLTIGKRTLSGRDAVVWIREHRLGQQVRRDIEVYIEGDASRPARVVEPDGTTTKDRLLLVVLRQQGSLRARVGRHSDRPVETLPLYRRATATRKGLQPTTQTAAPAPGQERPARVTRPRPRLPQPVTYRADSTTSKLMPDPRDPETQIRVTIVKGNVYLSHGSPDSDLFLEIRSDAAVLYTDPKQEPKLGAAAVVAAYLEGDVILRRGERTVEANRLFYDFRNGRAIIIQPVFRTIQQQRDIPVYIRAKEARQLAARPAPQVGRVAGYRWKFREAIVTTSDFHTPEYHIGARRVYFEDTTPYDDKGVALAERGWRTKLVNTTFNLRSIPLLWLPYVVGDAEEGHTALRKMQVGKSGRLGWGGESEWFLFRLLGLPRPEGFKGRLEADWHERGVLLGPKLSYSRETYSGYALAYGVLDNQREDDFGTERDNIQARRQRGRLLWRHKQFLPRDWQLQLEASYLCDENFLEEFFPGEFWTGKEQETLLYAKKQRDNWAITGLVKWQINDFARDNARLHRLWLAQTEALPDLAGYLVGQSLWRDRLTWYSEGHIGVVRFRPPELRGPAKLFALRSSRSVARVDVREEIDLPLAVGPVKLLPYVAGRATYWEDSPRDQGLVRPWGQAGVNATMHIWRIYNQVKSRLWDLNRIKHVITPYGSLFWSCTPVQPHRPHPFSPGIEQNVRRLGGGAVGVRQLWQTKRGPEGNQHTADWLRVNAYACFFDGADIDLPGDGRYFPYRPEYSLARNALNGDVTWHISDATTFLADANYDTDSGDLARANAGLAVSRDPRLKYYGGVRYIKDIDSSVGTFGLDYQINPKYTVSVFEQYDFDLAGGTNLGTTVTLIRKFPRIFTAITFVYDRSQNDVGVVFSIWPEGISEAFIGSQRLSLLHAGTERD